MKVFTDVHGRYVERRGERAQWLVVSRPGELSITDGVLTTPEQVDEFVEALAGAAADAARLNGRPRYRPQSPRKPKDGWPISMETKA